MIILEEQGSAESYDDFKYGNEFKNNHEDNYYPEDDDDNIAEPEDNDQHTNDINQPEELTGWEIRRNRCSIHQSILGANGKEELDGPHWRIMNTHICPILGAMVVAEQAGV